VVAPIRAGDQLHALGTGGDADPDVRANRSSGSLTLTAFHAGSGDCVRLEYARRRRPDQARPSDVDIFNLPAMGNDGRRRHGLGSAFKQGLGRWLDEVVRPKHVGVAVVTHIDGDHIEGMLCALKEGSAALRPFSGPGMR
jgi:hypothetical protein